MRRANPVFIPKDSERKPKSMCEVCHVYRVPYGDKRVCPNCGTEEGITNREEGEFLNNEFRAEPYITNKNKIADKTRTQDFPKGATSIVDN